MKKTKLMCPVVFLAFLAVSHHVESLNTEMLGTLSEDSMKTFNNQTFTMNQARKKCVEYLTVSLSEFLQKVPKTPFNVSAKIKVCGYFKKDFL